MGIRQMPQWCAQGVMVHQVQEAFSTFDSVGVSVAWQPGAGLPLFHQNAEALGKMCTMHGINVGNKHASTAAEKGGVWV